MKSFLFSLCALGIACTVQANAQALFNKSNFGFEAGTYAVNRTTEPSMFSVMSGSNIKVLAVPVSSFDATANLTYAASPIPQFPDALVSESFEFLNSSAGMYIFNVFVSDETGFKQSGVLVAEQRYGLAALTGFATDSLIIPEQIAPTTGERMVVKFPATAESVWSSNFSWSVTGEVTVALAGITKAPISKIGSVSQNDSVIGWGQAQIPTGNGGLSAFYDVLVEQRTFVQVDSFMMNGQPIEPLLAASLGIVQGKTTTERSRKFWRNNFVAMATVDYGSDATYTSPQGMSFDGSIPAAPNSVDENTVLGTVAAYPNPTNDKITISYNQHGGNQAVIEFVSIIGAVVKSVPVFSPAETVNVPVSISDLASGMYRYSVRNQNGAVIGQGNVTVTK